MESDLIFRDRIELPMKLVVDVTGRPDELKAGVEDTLRRLLSDDEGERALAQEDFLMAFIMDTPAACTMTCGGDSAAAIENLRELGCLSAEVDDAIFDGRGRGEDGRTQALSDSDWRRDMRVIITGITGKGMAYLWIARHVRPEWFCNALLRALTPLPSWVFPMIGVRGMRSKVPIVFDNSKLPANAEIDRLRGCIAEASAFLEPLELPAIIGRPVALHTIATAISGARVALDRAANAPLTRGEENKHDN